MNNTPGVLTTAVWRCSRSVQFLLQLHHIICWIHQIFNSWWLHWESRINPISFTERIDSLKLTPFLWSSFFFSLDLTKSLLSHLFEDPYSPFHSHLYQLLPQILLDLIPEVLTPWYDLLYGIPHLDVQTFSWPTSQDYPRLFHLYVTVSKLKGSYISRYIILIVCFLIIDTNHGKRYLHLQ